MKILFHTNHSVPGLAKILESKDHQLIITTSNIYQGLYQKPDCIVIDHLTDDFEKQIIRKSKLPCYYINDIDNFLLNIDKELLKSYQLRIIKETTKQLFPIVLYTWFHNGTPFSLYTINIYQNKFLAGNLGEETKLPQSILTYPLYDLHSKLINRIFTEPLLQLLKHAEYNGPLGIECIISADDHYPYFVQFRTGIDIHLYGIYALLNQYKKLFESILLQTHLTLENYLCHEFCLSVACSVPHYPYSLQPNGFQLPHLNVPNLYYHSPILSYITSTGKTWQEARLNVGKIINKLKEQSNVLQFRIDAGYQGERLDELMEMYNIR